MNERSGATARDLLVCLPDLPEREHVGTLPAGVGVFVLGSLPDAGLAARLAEADFVVPLPRSREVLFDALSRPATRIRVLQTLSAGVDWLRGHVPDDVVVCNARGIYDAPLAEWVVGAILAMQRGLVAARDAQGRRDWAPFEPDELGGRRVVILGFGAIGTAIAERLRPFGVEIVGVARTARPGVRPLADLDDVLAGADIVVNMLPLTSETVGLLDAARLGRLPDGALLVNAGRGRTVDTAALLGELQAVRLRAVLDVTDPEPLPADHPLWGLPNVLISPHLAGDSPATGARAFALAGDQIRRFAAGTALVNEVPRYLLA